MKFTKRSMQENKSNSSIHRFTKEFYRGNVGYIILASCETALDTVLSLAIAWLLQQIFDLISKDNTQFELGELFMITLGMLGLFLISYMLQYFSKPIFSSRSIAQYKEYIFREITKKNISAFSAESSSLYLSAMTNDITAIHQGYVTNVFEMASSILLFVSSLIMMLCYSPLLTLVAVVLSLLPVIISIAVGDKVAKAEKSASDINEVYTATINDALGGFAVIKSFKAEVQMCKIFSAQVRRLAKAQCKKEKMNILVSMLGQTAGFAAQFGVFLFAAYLAINGKGITGGVVMMFTQMMNYLLGPLRTIPVCIAQRKSAKALVCKIANALDTNTRKDGDSCHKTLTDRIELRDLSFSYSGEKQVLSHINYSFEQGKKYAIVGASGCGKSTLLNLLMSSYHGYNGEILYDGTELRKISTSDLYDIESIIHQNVFVFNASIRDNITMFKDFPEDEIKNAIRLSGLEPLIKQKGEDYLCGENGNALSGGEKQRISIARSLLKRSCVLLIDEATAALDAETAYQVSSSILGLQGITAIEITHALDEALLKKYDGILTLKDGKLIENGTFEELIEKKGYFYSLFTISQ